MLHAELAPPDLTAYARRLGLASLPAADLDGVARLVQAHAEAIPFENLAVLSGEVPGLELPTIEDKLLHRGRGGYCYEQNLLFAAVLRALGLEVRLREGRVRAGLPAAQPTPRTHLALELRWAGEAWLCDVGFGHSAPLAPLRLASTDEQAAPDGARYRLLPLAHGARALQVRGSDGWVDCYWLQPGEPTAPDLVVGNWYVATHPHAMLGNNLLVARAADGGRWSLLNRRLSFRRASDGHFESSDLPDAAALAATLAGRFGLRLDGLDVERLWARAAAAAASA